MSRIKALLLSGNIWRSLLESLTLGCVVLMVIDFQQAEMPDELVWSGILCISVITALWLALRLKPSDKRGIKWFFQEGWPAAALPLGLIWAHAILRSVAVTIFSASITTSEITDMAILAACALFYTAIRLLVLAWLWLEIKASHSIQWGFVRTIVLVVVIFTVAGALVVLYPLTGLSYLSVLSEDLNPNAAILASIFRSLLPNLLLGIIAAGFAVMIIILPSIGISYLVSRPLNRRLQTLTAAARELRAGKLEARVPSAGHDEIAQLQDDFNSMAENIQQTNQNLNESRDQIAALLKNQRELTAQVSHELRTPVATLRGYLEKSLDSAAPIPDVLSKDLEIMHREVLRLQGLIDDLFTLSRVDLQQLELHIARVDVGALVERVVDTLKPGAWKNGRVEISHLLPEKRLFALADEQRLEQVILNLLNNAVRHTGPGGLVVVTVVALPEAVEIAVADTGEGIAAERLPYIWERFNHGSDANGSGLGLALVKELVERMQGEVGAESTLNTGSRFWVHLPLAKIYMR